MKTTKEIVDKYVDFETGEYMNILETDEWFSREEIEAKIEKRVSSLVQEFDKQLKLPEKKRHPAFKQLKGRIAECDYWAKNLFGGVE